MTADNHVHGSRHGRESVEPEVTTARSSSPVHRTTCPCRSDAAHQDAHTDPPRSSVLENLEWTWLNRLIRKTGRSETQGIAEVFFKRLLDASTAPTLGAVLKELDEWDLGLRGSEDERQVARALKLLGVDKKLSIERNG